MDSWSNWKSEDNKALSSILKIVEKIPVDNDNEIFDLLDEEKSIILNSANNADCSLFINVIIEKFPCSEKKLTPLMNFITDILIISEAKTIETFINAYHEYYKTFQSILISNLPDTKIYKTLITFTDPQKHILLNLKSLFCKETVWIYGIFIKTLTVCSLSARSIQPEECGANTRIDSILKEKNVILSEKALSFKKLYSLFNISQNKCEKTLALDYDSLEFSKKEQLQCIGKLELFGETEIKIPSLSTIVDNVECQKIFAKLDHDKLLINKIKDLMSQKKSACYSSHLKDLIPIIPESANDSPENKHGTQTSQDLYQNEVHNDNLSTKAVHDGIHEKLIYDLMEPILEKKLQEFESKMKVQIEKSNLVILNKLSHLETLLMKIIDNKASS